MTNRPGMASMPDGAGSEPGEAASRPSPERSTRTSPDAGGGFSRSWVKWLVMGAVVVVAGVWYVASGDDAGCDPLADVRAGLCVTPPDQRPDAPVTALPILGDGSRTLSIDEFGDDVVVVNFWGSWCVPCRTEQPDLNEVAHTYADRGVSFVGVDVNEVSETNGLRHEESLEIPYPSMWDPDFSYAGEFEVAGPRVMPSTVIIDRQDRVAVAIHGATDSAELSSLLDAVLAASAPT